jgi:hypothetical protein
VRANDGTDAQCEAPGEVLQFITRQFFGIDRHSALSAPERDTDDGAFPGHPHRQRPHFVERHVLVIPNAAFRRPTRRIVLDPVTTEHAHRTIVHGDREIDRGFVLAFAQDAA